jgi:hypothetical protein
MEENNHKDSNEQEKDSFALLYILVAIVISLWAVSLLALKDDEHRGTFGDMFGAVNALFSGLAMAGIIFTILLQKKELGLQRVELRETRNEFKLQNQTLKQQRFESTFFNSLTLLNNIIENMNFSYGPSSTNYNGRKCFERYFKDLESTHVKFKQDFIAHNQEALLQYNNHIPVSGYKQIILGTYMPVYKKHQASLGHYFRTLYNIIKFIDQSNVENAKYYTNLVRSQFSSYEHLMLFYNCLTPYGEEKFKPLIIKYSLLDNLPFNELLDPEHKDLYPEKAYL